MKRLFATFLSVVLLISMTAVPASAASTSQKYDYKKVTIETPVYYGYEWCKVRITFDQAATGNYLTSQTVFTVNETDDGEEVWVYNSVASGEDGFPEQAIVLKDNSKMKVEILEGFFEGLSANYVDGIYRKCSFMGYSSDAGNPIMNPYPDGASIYGWETEPFTSGSIEQLFAPEGNLKFACQVEVGSEPYETNHVWLVKESDAETFKIGVPELKREGLSLNIFDQGEYNPLGFTVTNRGFETVTGYYALLSYRPVTSYWPPTEVAPEELELFYGQVIPIDVNLLPHQSMYGQCYAIATGWTTMTHKWIKFDSKAERDAFLSNSALKNQMDGFGYYEIDSSTKGIKWMKDTFNVVIKSGKY